MNWQQGYCRRCGKEGDKERSGGGVVVVVVVGRVRSRGGRREGEK
jgi:hypothetical protein